MCHLSTYFAQFYDFKLSRQEIDVHFSMVTLRVKRYTSKELVMHERAIKHAKYVKFFLFSQSFVFLSPIAVDWR